MESNKVIRTQGEIKMERYITDLVRNVRFRASIKRLDQLGKKFQGTSGKYNSWTEKEKKESDLINSELISIIKTYEEIKKRANKLFGKNI